MQYENYLQKAQIMKIGLIDVDSRNYPNLALMKISAWHKKQGDEVEWYLPFYHYNIVYLSKVFSFTADYNYKVNADIVVRGGTGYALHGAGGDHYLNYEDQPLSDEIEHIYPDYNIYKIKNCAYGFLSRGCPRGCKFCIVGKKEGFCSKKIADLTEFWKGQKNIVLNDPNILACSDWKDLLSQLKDSKSWIDFNQGLDARLLTEEKCLALSELKIKEIHFAWDNYYEKDLILPKLKLYLDIAKNKPHTSLRIVYVLVNFNTTLEQDLERIYTLKNLGYWAYVMVYDKKNANKIYHHLERWCNNRFIFASCSDFSKYQP